MKDDAMSIRELAEARFQQGYSCSQAVFSSLAEPWGIYPAVSLRVAAGFGGGMARSGATCGCVTAGMMAIGLAQSSVTPDENRAEKEKTSELCRQFMINFAEKNGSTMCLDLLGVDIRTPQGLAQARDLGIIKSKCPNFVRDAVEMVESLVLLNGAHGKLR